MRHTSYRSNATSKMAARREALDKSRVQFNTKPAGEAQLQALDGCRTCCLAAERPLALKLRLKCRAHFMPTASGMESLSG